MTMRRFLYPIIAVCLLACCRPSSAKTESTMPRTAETSYLALGDSYTIGHGVVEADRWPVVLADRKGWSSPVIVARTGWTVNELHRAIEQQELSRDFDVVTLQIGVNDQFRGGTVEAYATDFASLLDTAVVHAAGDHSRLLVVSIPDYGVTPFGRARGGDEIGRAVDEFNATARREVDRRGIRWVDVTAISRRMPDAVVSDGLHPDGEQYRAWADAVDAALP